MFAPFLFLLAIFALRKMSGLIPSFPTSNVKMSGAGSPTVLRSYPKLPIPNAPTLNVDPSGSDVQRGPGAMR